MEKAVSVKIKNSDFIFENSPVPILANGNFQRIELPGLTVGPFEEGNEYDVEYWIARQLVNNGVARFRNKDMLDSNRLYKIQWKERVQSGKQVSKLPTEFYPKLRRYLEQMRQEMTKNPERTQEFGKAKQVAKDIIISRLKKIVSLASAPPQTRQILENLTTEEKFLYNKIYRLTTQWRKETLENEEDKK